jgi:2-amino-4-hydroxy-6-hydroxymethyldihydropteridine diphosphokinase
MPSMDRKREKLEHTTASEIIFLSLGSNVGDRKENLHAAIVALAGAGITVKRVSSIYETEPVDYLDQPWFLNCVVEGQTSTPAIPLLRKLRALEQRMGSQKLVARGPRLLDIDILLYGQQTIDAPELQVPHPRMLSRRFVLKPLAEISPDLKHPSWNGSAAELLKNLADHSVVKRTD